MSFTPLALPPALEDPSVELVNSYPKGRRRFPQRRSWEEIALCLAGCLSLSWAAGDSNHRGFRGIVLGQSQTGSAMPESPRASLLLYRQSHSACVTKAQSTLRLESDLELNLAFCSLLRAPAEGCFGVRWVYMTDFILPTDH